MSDYIKLPKSMLTSALWMEENFARYFVYLLNKANDDGLIMASQYQTAIDLALSRQKIRTLQKKAEEEGLIITQSENKLRDLSTHKSTHKSTQQITTLRLNNQRTYKNSQPTNQPTNQPTKQPRKSKQIEEIQVEEVVTICHEFVAPEFRDIWQMYMKYRKEINKPYKSISSERIAYNKMVKMANGDPEVAKSMVERAILGQWQGLYEDNNGKGNNYIQGRFNAADRDKERIANHQELAGEILRRSKARGDK